MAQDIDMTTPEDKGKGKATDGPKDDKPVINGKKEEEKPDGMSLAGCLPDVLLGAMSS